MSVESVLDDAIAAEHTAGWHAGLIYTESYHQNIEMNAPVALVELVCFLAATVCHGAGRGDAKGMPQAKHQLPICGGAYFAQTFPQ